MNTLSLFTVALVLFHYGETFPVAQQLPVGLDINMLAELLNGLPAGVVDQSDVMPFQSFGGPQSFGPIDLAQLLADPTVTTFELQIPSPLEATPTAAPQITKVHDEIKIVHDETTSPVDA